MATRAALGAAMAERSRRDAPGGENQWTRPSRPEGFSALRATRARSPRVPLLVRLVRPLFWPRWVRRVSIVALPLAVPLWLALVIVTFLSTSLQPLVWIFNKLWNGRQRRAYRYDRYSYQRSVVPARRIVVIPRPEFDVPEQLDAAE